MHILLVPQRANCEFMTSPRRLQPLQPGSKAAVSRYRVQPVRPGAFAVAFELYRTPYVIVTAVHFVRSANDGMKIAPEFVTARRTILPYRRMFQIYVTLSALVAALVKHPDWTTERFWHRPHAVTVRSGLVEWTPVCPAQHYHTDKNVHQMC